MHIVDIYLQTGTIHHIRAARHHQVLQCGGDNGGIAAHVPPYGNGSQSILDVEQAVHTYPVDILP